MRDRYLNPHLGSLLDPVAAKRRPIGASEDAAALDALAREATAGSTEALGQLYDFLVGPIYRYVASRVQPREDAEDLTQLIVERLVKALPKYRHRGTSFHVWAFRIARNAVVDHQRGRRREHSIVPADAAQALRSAFDVESASLRDEELHLLRQGLERLTRDQHEAVVLRYVSGLSAEDAGAVMGRSSGTVRGLTFRAIAALRRELRSEDDR